MSNEMLVTARQIPPRAPSRTRSIAPRKFITERCSIITPLGVPVEPDV
jgi:hypothetical protein